MTPLSAPWACTRLKSDLWSRAVSRDPLGETMERALGLYMSNVRSVVSQCKQGPTRSYYGVCPNHALVQVEEIKIQV